MQHILHSSEESNNKDINEMSQNFDRSLSCFHISLVFVVYHVCLPNQTRIMKNSTLQRSQYYLPHKTFVSHQDQTGNQLHASTLTSHPYLGGQTKANHTLYLK